MAAADRTARSTRSGASSRPRLIAGLARMVRDVGLAEELAQDALVAALEQWPRDGRAGQPGRLADGHRQAPRDRPCCAGASCSSASTRSSAASSRREQRAATRRARRGARRRHRRRPAAAGVHRLPPGALDRGARRAHAAPARRPDHRRDRARVPRARSRRSRSASCAPSARSPRRSVPFEVPRGDELARAARVGARGDLPDLQRGLLGDRRRRLDAARRCARTRCASGRILAELAPRRAGGARAGRADGDPGLARARARRPGGRADPAARPEPRALGPAADPPRPRGARARRGARRRARARTRCRPRSPPATRGRARAEETDWARIAALYDALAAARAVAGRRAQPRGRGGDGVRARRPASSSSTRCADEPALRGLPPAAERARRPARKLGRCDEARAEFERAAALTRNERERRLLLERAASHRPA